MVYMYRRCCLLLTFLALTLGFTVVSSNDLQSQVDKFCGKLDNLSAEYILHPRKPKLTTYQSAFAFRIVIEKISVCEVVLATPKKCDDDMVKPRKVVSFLTWFSKPNIQLGDHEAVKFNKIIENIGGGYNPATGKFTAPVSGIYTISVSVMSEPINSMHLGIMRNTQLLTILYSSSKTYPQASNTLNLFLKKKDTVWVQRRSRRVLHAHSKGPFNVFSGVLVTRM